MQPFPYMQPQKLEWLFLRTTVPRENSLSKPSSQQQLVGSGALFLVDHKKLLILVENAEEHSHSPHRA